MDRRSFLVGATSVVGGFTLLGQAAGCEPGPIAGQGTNDPWTKLALWFFSLEDANSFGLTRDCARLNCEWDMVENGIRAGEGPSGYADVNACSVVHRNTNSPCGVADQQRIQSVAKPDGGLCDWHVWSGKWTAAEVTTYLDGQLLGTQPTYETFAQPMYFLISAAPTNAAIPDDPPRPAFIETQVDWFRVWQR